MRKFKNIISYQFDEPVNYTCDELESRLSDKPLHNCMAQEIESFGWVSAFKSGESFVEEINDCFFFRLGIQRKRVTRNAIKTAVEQRADELNIDISTRSRFREVEDAVIAELTANAHVEESSMSAYIDKRSNKLIVDATSVKNATMLTALLRKTLGTLPTVGDAPQVSIPMTLTHWAQEGIDSSDFDFGNQFELKELQKEQGGTARYRGIGIDSKEIQDNLDEGWQITRAHFIYKETISFNLDQNYIIKQVKYLDMFDEQIEADQESSAIAQSSANAYLMSATIRSLQSDLIKLIEC